MLVNDRDLFRQFMDGLPTAACIVDNKGTFLYWNEAARRISGYQAQEAVGRSCAEILYHGSEPKGTLCGTDLCPLKSLMKSVHAGHSGHLRLSLRHKQGQILRILTQVVPLRNDMGEIVAMGQVFQQEASGAGPSWPEREQIPSSEAQSRDPHSSEEQLLLHWDYEKSSLVVFLLTMQKSREMELNRGPAMVRAALHAISQTVENSVWIPHYLGPWTDHRFLLLVPDCDRNCCSSLVQELTGALGSCGVIWWGDRVVPEIQIQTYFAQDYASPESLLSSIDPTWRKPDPVAGD
jgi:PAS domain S-box-containing protein